MEELPIPLATLEDVAIQGYDSERRVFYWNEASRLLYGYSRDEALGRRLEDLIIPEAMVEAVSGEIDLWLAGGPPPTGGRIGLRHKNGGTVLVHSNHLSLRDATDTPRLFCIDIPLNTQERLEATLSDLAAAAPVGDEGQGRSSLDGSFLATLSHEVRTPLNAILGFSELLAQRLAPDGADEVAADYSSSIRNAGVELTRVLEQSLALLGTAPVVLQPQPRVVPVQDVLVEVAAVLLATCPSRDDLISVDRVADDLRVMADPFLVKHGLSALARFALANAPAGQPVVLTAQARSGASDMVLLCVEDAGPPLPDPLRLQLLSGHAIGVDPYRAENQSALFHLSIVQRIAIATGALLSFERTDAGANRAVLGLHRAGPPAA
ncbi:histidine kinase dimerization/phospho-acceptor domain-containing protein [Roseospirillum parvum]|uniref:histidine kinase n=1 Tax=Roseospirillum parvum TaxID=83401 RepID=A0A1G8AS45_9PROT|nr:histidine kinase dimerization/phospho-acceptor domain-containing protein [Roseospirillum parvum]SDH23882.1 PAS domain S-box-containing protein [Roseospirillum parvum]